MGKHDVRRLLAALLAGTTAFGCAPDALAVGDGVDVICDEAYYATTDHYGNLSEGSVVKSYILNGAQSVTDYGSYDEVMNLTDGTAPAMDGDTITFHTEGARSHFYFEGKTDEPFYQLPWKIAVHYAFNGVPMRAEELAGKSGVAEISIDATPNEAASDYARHNYVMVINAAFNQNDILSLEAPGAQTQLIGNLRFAVFMCLPGEERHFTLRVGAEEFAFNGLTFLLAPATLSQLEQIADLSRNRDDIEENYEKLSGSLDELLDALDNVSGSLYGSASGLDALNGARGTISAGKDEVYDKADALRADLDAFNAALEPVSEDLKTASSALTDVNGTLRGLTEQTTALRADLEKLDGILKDLRGQKKNALDVFDSLSFLSKKLSKLFDELDQTKISKVSAYSSLYNNVSELDVDGAMGAIATEYDTLKALYRDDMTLDDFGAAALAASGSASSWADVKTAYSGVAAALAAMGVSGAPSDAQLAAAAAITPDAATQTALVTGFKTYAGVAAAYGRGIGDFPAFLEALAKLTEASGGAENAAKLRQLASAYSFGTDLTEDLSDGAKEIDQKINKEIQNVNSAIDTINDLVEPTAEMVDAVESLAIELYQLKPLVESTDDFAELGQEDAEKLKKILDEVERLQKVLDRYEPKAQDAIATVDGVNETLRGTLDHAAAFYDAAEALMKRSGEELDAAARQSLSSLSRSLRATADALAKNNGVRNAKETVTDIVEDIWNDHTGDMDNLLLMDVTADVESLTSPKNPTPQSVQILIRTQEIALPEDEPEDSAAAETEQLTFFARVAKMLRDFWAAITGLFHR